ncbi:hypothetical protein B0H11DRAFT_2214095 [Mycena galericulata]|nr:hypothetical protein B0H11DRAFT_2214095 [Mycena galericulata]
MSSQPIQPPVDCGARYTHLRQACLAGYRNPTFSYTAMLFDLRHIPCITSRIVKIDGHVFELWSPNSSQLPFFPGTMKADFVPAPAQLLSDRRYNGHAGRFDCLYSPQYWRAGTVHWPFMRRPVLVTADDPTYAAFAPLTEHWVSEQPALRRGRLSEEFVGRLSSLNRELDQSMLKLRAGLSPESNTWKKRPDYANDFRITRLLGLRSWDEVIDLGVAVQRGLREKEGWIAWLTERFRQDNMASEWFKWTAMPLANEAFIGLWVNGLEETIVLRHMAAGVPCFIIHEYPPNSLVGDIATRPGVPIFPDFVSGTDLECLLSDDNPYQRFARFQPGRLDALHTSDDGQAPAQLATTVNEERSSSLYLESLPSLEVPDAGAFAAAPATFGRGTSSFPTPSEGPSGSRAPLEAARPPSGDRPDRAADKFAHRALTRVTVDLERVDWIVAPTIAAAKDGKLDKYELDNFNGIPAFIYRGKRHDTSAKNVWYDRENGRRLFFGEYVPEPGVVSEGIFGAPAPRFPFYIVDGERGRPQKPSFWMYRAEKPHRYQVGKRQGRPSAADLPLKAPMARTAEKEEGGGEPSEEKGKGKGKAKEGDLDAREASVDEDDEYAGMDVEDPCPFEVPSHIIVLDGVDNTISAVTFKAMAADRLYANRVSPLSIIRARGRMWVRFANVTDARRALGSLSHVGRPSATSFASDADWAEATGYTYDMWTPDMEAGIPFAGMTEPGPITGFAPGPASIDQAIDFGFGERSTANSNATMAAHGPNPNQGSVEIGEEANPSTEGSAVAVNVPLILAAPTESAPSPGETSSQTKESEPTDVIMTDSSPLVPETPVPSQSNTETRDELMGDVTSNSATPITAALSTTSSSIGNGQGTAIVPPSVVAPPTAPRAMRRPLEDRLTDPPSHTLRPSLMERIASSVPLAQRLAESAPALAARIELPRPSEGPSKRPRLTPTSSLVTPPRLKPASSLVTPPRLKPASSLVTPPPPSDDPTKLEVPKKKVRRGKRSGRQVKEKEERRRLRNESEALDDAQSKSDAEEEPVASGSGAVTVETDAMPQDLELSISLQDWIDEAPASPRWSMDDDDDPPIAGPAR